MDKYVYALLCDVMIDIIRGKKNIDEIGAVFDPEFNKGSKNWPHILDNTTFDKYCKSWAEFQYGAYNDFSAEYPTMEAFVTKCREIVNKLIEEKKVQKVPFGNDVGSGVDEKRTSFDRDGFIRFIIERQIKQGMYCTDTRRQALLESAEHLRYFQQYFPESAELLENLSNCFEKYHNRFEEEIRFEDILKENGFYSEYNKFLSDLAQHKNEESIPDNIRQALSKFSEVYIDGYDEVARKHANDLRRSRLNLRELQAALCRFKPEKAKDLVDTSANNRYMLTGNNLFGLAKRSTVKINDAGKMQLYYQLILNSGLMQLDRAEYLYGNDIVLEELATKETVDTADQKILEAAQNFFSMTNEQVLEQYDVRISRGCAIPMIPNSVVMDVVMAYLQKNGNYDSIVHTWIDGGVIRIKQKDEREIFISCISGNCNSEETKRTCVITLPDGSEIKYDSIVKEHEMRDDRYIGINDLIVENINVKGTHELIPDIVKKLDERFGIRTKEESAVNVSDVKAALEAHALTVTPASVGSVLGQASVGDGLKPTAVDKKGVTKDE